MDNSKPKNVKPTSSPQHKKPAPKQDVSSNSDKSSPINSSVKKSSSNLKPLTPVEMKRAKKLARPRWRKWLRRLLVASVIGFGLAVVSGIAVFAWFAKDLPSPDQLENRVVAESTKIYDKTGEHILYETGQDVRRTYTKIDDIPQNLRDATVALEDKNFYNHHGFDPLGILRSAGINIASDKQVGGSTITQQFVKLAIVGGDKTYSRKIKELILSVELERKYDKNQILEFYLNEASYGGVNMGVAAAARSYFDKNPNELTLAECALLASIPQRPTYYISQDQDALYTRKDFALDRMAEEGYITKEEADAAKAEDVTLKQTSAPKVAPHFVDYVMAQLEDDFGAGFINQGLKVTTSIDLDKQKIAEEVIADHIADVESYGGSNAALVSIDAHTGQVLAMVGSKNYYADDYDGQVNVATSLRQPGSSFKPIVYLTAFANGYNPNTILFDVETDFPTETGNYHPHNYSLGTSGPISMRRALSNSLNIPAVKTLYLVGVDKALDMAESLGYSSFQDRSRFGLAVVLGGGEVQLLEHTSTFATFAREGKRHPIATILKVEDQKGEVLYEWVDSEEQVVDQAAVQQLNSVLSDAGARGSTFANLNIPGKTIAGKTGTTNDFRDAWTMAYTPSFATGVWTGNNDNSEMHVNADGIYVAAPIMNDYMSRILDGLPDESFTAPPSVNANKPVLWGQTGTTVEKYVDKDTQHIIPDDCVDSYPEEFKQKREFKEVHTILYYLKKDDPAGAPPSDPTQDPMYNSWEAAVQKWAEGQDEYFTEETELEDCNLRSADQTPKVSITSPTSGSKLTSSTFEIETSINPGSSRSTKKVEYIIDSTVVDAKTTLPFTSTYSPTNLTSGSHTLTVRVTNDRDNTAESSVTFTYSAQSSTNSNVNSNTNSGNGNKNSNTNADSNKNDNKNKNSNTNKKKKD